MNSILIAAIIFAALASAVALGMLLRRLLPANHLSSETRDTIKLSMGLVATMAALVLGLLVSSAKGSYDTTRSEVSQMAAKISILERGLAIYGDEAADARAQLRIVLEENIREMWPEGGLKTLTAANAQRGENFYGALLRLNPQDEAHRSLKSQIMAASVDVGQLRALLVAQSVPSVSSAMLVIVVSWLAIIFLSFSMIAPPNATATIASLVSALAVSGAIYLILELDSPFGGLLQVSSQPMLNALNQLSKGGI